MKYIYQYRDITWLDLENPTKEEIEEIVRDYGVEAEISADLTSPTARHTVKFADDHVYLVLHFPALSDIKDDEDVAYELDFILGEKYIITVHYDRVPAIELFSKALSEDSLPGSISPKNPRYAIFFGLLRTLMSELDHKLSKIDHWVRDIERNMFRGKEKKTIFEISEASRHLIDIRKITAVYPDTFLTLKEEGAELFGKKFVTMTVEILNLYKRNRAKLDTLFEAVKELRETNASILSTRQNEAMKILTIVVIVATVAVGIALVWVGLLAV